MNKIIIQNVKLKIYLTAYTIQMEISLWKIDDILWKYNNHYIVLLEVIGRENICIYMSSAMF